MEDFKLDQNLKIASGFKTPEHYFENFPSRLSKVIIDQPKVIPLNSRSNILLLAVAAILILALIIPIFNKLSATSNDFDPVAAENYLAIQSGISEHLVELLDDEDIKSIKIDNNLEDSAVEDLLSSNPDLEHYIIN